MYHENIQSKSTVWWARVFWRSNLKEATDKTLMRMP